VSLDLTTESPTPTATNPRTEPGSERSATLAAVGRDLHRLTRVLAEQVTSVRRAALVRHLGWLVDQLRDADPDLAGRHASGLSRMRHEFRRWSREPWRRTAVLAASEDAVAALALPVAGGRQQNIRSGPVVECRGYKRVSLLDLPGQGPTELAFRHFWLLDDLASDQAEPLTREFTAPARWILRNVLSGGYNRRAHLMWIGGGSGPAV